MQILKCIRIGKVPRWSSLVPFLCYLLFIIFILNLSFPLKSSKQTINGAKVHNHHSGGEGGGGSGNNANGDNDDDDDDGKSKGHKIELKRQNDNQERDQLDMAGKHDLNTLRLIANVDGNSVEVGGDNGNGEDVLMNQLSNKDSKKKNSKLLELAFAKADLNKDKSLSVQELSRYINKRIRDHIDYAIKTNPINFAQIDISPRDGLISWDEYHAHFLRSRGLEESYVQSHNEKQHVRLDRKTKEEMMKDKAMWTEAARTDTFSLTLDEFLLFRHPESSAVNLLSLVDDLLRQFDADGDDHLTVDEFSEVSADDLDDKWRKYIITKTVQERQDEFRKLIDRNKDGKANRSELLSYVDPRNTRHALQEAATLFDVADLNRDNRLTLDEVLEQADMFITSKMIATSQNFHDEF